MAITFLDEKPKNTIKFLDEKPKNKITFLDDTVQPKEDEKTGLLSKAMESIKSLASYLGKKGYKDESQQPVVEQKSVADFGKVGEKIQDTSKSIVSKLPKINKSVVDKAKDVGMTIKSSVVSPFENIDKMYHEDLKPLAQKAVPYITALGKSTAKSISAPIESIANSSNYINNKTVPAFLDPSAMTDTSKESVYAFGERKGTELKGQLLEGNKKLFKDVDKLSTAKFWDKSKPLSERFLDLNKWLAFKGPLKLAEKAQDSFIKYFVPTTPTETIATVLALRELEPWTHPEVVKILNKAAGSGQEVFNKTLSEIVAQAPKSQATEGIIQKVNLAKNKSVSILDVPSVEKSATRATNVEWVNAERKSVFLPEDANPVGFVKKAPAIDNTKIQVVPVAQRKAMGLSNAPEEVELAWSRTPSQEAKSAIKSSEDLAKFETNSTVTDTGVIIAPTAEQQGVGKIESLRNNFTRSGSTFLKKQGKSGEELGNRLESVLRDSDIYSGSMKESFMPDLVKLSQGEKEAVYYFLDKGQTVGGMTPQAQQVANKIKQLTDAQGQMLESMDIKVYTSKGSRPFYSRKNFFPHEPDYDMLKTPEGRSSEIEHLLSTGQVDNVEDAKRVVDAVIERRSPILSDEALSNYKIISNKKYAGLERARAFDLKNIVQDPVVAFNRSFDRLGRRLSEIKYLGQNNEIADSLVTGIANEGGDFESAKTLLNRMTRREPINFELDKALASVRSFQAITKLGLASVKNLPQGFVNSYIKYGLMPAVKGVAKTFTKEGKEFARMTGVTNQAVIDDYIDALVGVGDRPGMLNSLARGTLKATGFRATETANRVIASNAGKSFLEDTLFPKLMKDPTNKNLRMGMREFGIDPDEILKRGALSQEDKLKAGWTATRRTQFSSDALTVPLFATTPSGRVVFQFKTFGYNQSKMLKDAFLQHPMDTATRTAVASSLIGVPVYEFDRLLRGKPEEEKNNIATEIINGFITIGSFGLISDMLSSSSKFGKQGALSFLTGPTGADIAEAGNTATQVVKQKSLEPAGRQLFRRIPVIGQIFTNRLFKKK